MDGAARRIHIPVYISYRKIDERGCKNETFLKTVDGAGSDAGYGADI